MRVEPDDRVGDCSAAARCAGTGDGAVETVGGAGAEGGVIRQVEEGFPDCGCAPTVVVGA